MSVRPPSDTPAELYLLLGRIDGKVDGIAGTLAAMNTRADSHEARLNTLEHNDAKRATYVPRFEAVEQDVDVIKSTLDQASGQRKGWFEASGAVKATIIALIMTATYFGYKFETVPEHPASTNVTVAATQTGK